LIHDNDRKISKVCDAVFESEGFHIIHTPFQAPNANAFTERWVRPIQEECLDQILIIYTNHLKRVINEFPDYYNTSRPHQGIYQQTPIPSFTLTIGTIPRRKILGGIINDYYRSPTLTALSTT